MRLLLDEMISFRVARDLRALGHDVVAIKRDRPELETRPDIELLREMAAERRAVVTNDILDFRLAHERLLAAREDHFGIVFTLDAVLPRNRASMQLWVKTLDALLNEHAAEDALLNRTHVLT